MKILNVSQNYFVKGGSDSYFFELETLLKRRGHEVVPFVAKNPANRPSEWSDFFPDGADFERPGLKDVGRYIYSSQAKTHIANLFGRFTPELAHFHIYYGKVTASVLNEFRKRGIPIVQTLHEYKLICPVYTCFRDGEICEKCSPGHYASVLLHRCNRDSLVRSALSFVEAAVSHKLGAIAGIDHFISVSHFHRKKMIEKGIPAGKVSTVHNFLNLDAFRPSHSVGKYVLYYGRIEKLKGLDTFVAAAKLLPGIRFAIAGDGAYKAQLVEVVTQQKIENVEFLGFITGEKLHDTVRESVCTVLPAQWYENCPMSVLETLALGRPALGTDIGGIPELIQDSVDGYVFKVGNAYQLAEKIEGLWMRRHDAAIEMGAAGRAKVQAEFGEERHYRKLLEIYAAVTN